jgi:hypothetical protein
LKKRTKKLLSVWCRASWFAAGRVIEAQDEAFFSSFFKKYLLWPAAL